MKNFTKFLCSLIIAISAIMIPGKLFAQPPCPPPLVAPIKTTGIVCVGATIGATDDSSGGSYALTNGNAVISGGSGATILITGVSTGLDTLFYTVTDACGSTTVVTILSIVGAPSPIIGADSVCSGSVLSLTDATTGGTWSLSNTTLVAVGSAAGTYVGATVSTPRIDSVTYTTLGGCSVFLVVTINPTPAPITSSIFVCTGQSKLITDATSGGTWTSSGTALSITSGGTLTGGLSPGTGTVTYSLGHGCFVTKTAFVVASPGPISPPSATICAGSSVALTDATSGGTWSSVHTSIATVGTSGIVSAGSSLGSDSIIYTTSGGCIAVALISVVAAPGPIIPSSPVSLCVFGTATLSDLSSGGTWSSTNTSVAVMSAPPGTVLGISPGTSIISYSFGGSCAATKVVTVYSTPTAILPASPQVCLGSTINLSDGVAGGTYNSTSGNVTVTPSGAVTGLSLGTAIITYSIGSGGCSVTTVVTVNALPSVGTISGVSSLCAGNTATLSETVGGGTWSSSSGTVLSVSGSGTTGFISGLSSGTSIVSYTVHSSSCTASATHVVTVNPVPSAGTITGPFHVCLGGTIALTDITAGGTIVWTSTDPTVSTVNSSTGIVTGVNIGTDNIVGTVTNGFGCSSSTFYGDTVDNAPGPISGTTSICIGSGTILTNTVLGGVWSSSNTSVATVSGSTVTGIATGTSTISYAIGSCYATKVVTVVLGPAAITGPSTLCVGGNIHVSDVTSGGTWSSSNSSVATVTSGGVVNGIGTGTSLIDYTVGSCSAQMTVTVNSAPLAIFPSNLSICVGYLTTMSDFTSGIGYGWSSSNTSVATAGGGSGSGTIVGVSAGTAIISYSNTGCLAVTTITVDALPTAITGTLSVCAGATTQLSNSVSGGSWTTGSTTISISSSGLVTGIAAPGGMVTYTMPGTCSVTASVTVNAAPSAILPSSGVSVCVGATAPLSDASLGGVWGSSSSGVATVNTGGLLTGVSAGTATISYTLTGGCFVTKTVSVNITPSAISPATASVCVGNSVTFSDAVGGGAWNTSNALVATASGSIITGSGAGTATISYSIGSCLATASITVNALPAGITPSGSVIICSSTTVLLSDVTPGGVWSSGTTSVATVSGGLVTGVAPGTANISYTNSFGCAAVKTVSVISGPVPISPASATVCTGSTVTFSDATGGGVWSSNNTSVANVSGGVVTGVGAGTATISYTTGSCFVTATASVNPSPAVITASGATTLCVGNTVLLSDVSGGGIWSSSASSKATVTAGGLVTGIAAGTATISYTTSGCSATKTVSVVSGPAAILPSSFTVCTGKNLTLIETTGGGTWSSSNAAVASVGTGGTVTGVAVGTATITYATSACFTIATVTVNLSATAGSITGTSAVCTGSTISLTDPAAGGVWSSSNSAIAKVGATGIVTGLTGGIVTISYTVANSCGSTSALATVTVNTAPTAGSIVGASAICAGTAVSMSDAVTGGVWAVTNSHATINSAGLLTGVSLGVDTIKYTVTTSCGTASTTKTVTVGSFLTAGSISGASVVCAGSTISLTDPAVGGIWSSSSTVIAKVGATGIVTGMSGGTATISYSITAVCGVATATHTITVNPAPNAGTITGPASLCAGTTASFSDAATGGVWSMTNAKAAIIGTGLVTGVTPGVDTIKYTVTNSCGTASATKSVTIGVFLSAGVISGPSIVCTGASVNLSDGVAGGVWSASNGSATVAGGVVTGVASGIDTIKYTVTASCGTAIATHTVTVNPAPNAGSISGASSVCSGGTIALSDAAIGGVWSSSSPSVATVSASGVVSPVASGTATISYTVTNSCGTARATTIITVGGSLSAGSITGSGTVCAGASIALTDATTGGVWSSSATTVATVGTDGTVTGTGAGTTTISYTISNICGTAAVTAVVTVNPLPNAGSITGATSLCIGSAAALSDAATGGAWSSSNTSVATVSGTGNVTPVSSGTATISYSVTNSCGTVAATQVISVGTGATAGTISGLSAVCSGSIVTLSDAAAGGVWSSTNTSVATINSSGMLTGGAVGTTVISYTVSNSCGTATATTTVTVGLSPNAGTIGGLTSLCAGMVTTYSDAAPGGVWSSSNTAAATITSTGVLTATTPFTTDVISYTVTNGCGTAVTSLTINIGATFTAGAISGPTNICLGTPATMSDAITGGAWSSTNPGVATVNSSGMVTGIATGTTVISYTVSGGCGTTAATATVTISSFPTAGLISGPSTVCVGTLITMTDGVAGGAWSSDNSNATITTAGVVTGISVGFDTIRYTVTNACGLASTSVTITINPFPSAGTITGSSTVCVGATINLSDAVGGGAWSSLASSVATISAGGVVTGVSTGTATIVYAIVNTCGTVNTTAVISVSPLPNPGTITGPGTICIGSAITLSDATPGGVWSAGNGNATVSGGIVTGVSSGTDPTSYTVSNACGSASAIDIVTISSTPSAGSISGPAGVCVGSGVTLIDLVPGGTWSVTNATGMLVGPGIVDGITVGTDTVYYTVTTSCGTSVATKILPVNPVPVVAPISGLGSECSGGTVMLSDATSGGVWSSSNPSIASVSASTGIVTGILTGTSTITYTVTNVFGCPTSVTYTNMVTAGSSLPAITGSGTVCIGSSVSLSDGVPGGTWNSSNTAIATVSSSGVVTGVAGGSVLISYTNTTSCGTATVTQAETVGTAPGVATISGPSAVCVGSGITLSDATTGGVWSSADPTITIVSGSGAVTGLSAGTAMVTYTVSNSCGTTSTIAIITINTLPFAGTISGSSIVCTGASASLTDAAPGGVWTSSTTNATVTGTGLVTGVTIGNTVISYSVSNGCGTAVATHAMSVNPFPFAGAITGPTTVCLGFTINLSDAISGGVWSSSSPGIASVTTTGAVHGLALGTVNINYTITNSCGTNASTIIVNVLPATECGGGPSREPATGVVTIGGENTVELQVFPNPGNGIFTVNLLSADDEQAQVTITNVVGRKVKEFMMATNKSSEIQLDQPAGVYILSATVGNRRYIEKITIR